MKWSIYKEKLRRSPDNKLHEEIGLWDNFPILFRGSYDLVRKKLLEHRSFRQLDPDNDDSHSRIKEIRDYSEWLEYVLGTVVLGLRNETSNLGTIGDKTYDSAFREIIIPQEKTYTGAIMMHPYQIRKLPTVNWIRVMANCLEQVVDNVLIPNNIPFCLHRTFYYNTELETQDYSTIVFWPDAENEQVMRKLKGALRQ